MKVLMLSTDQKILERGSKVSNRIASYGSFCESLTVIIAGTGSRVESVLAPNVLALMPGGTTKVGALLNVIDEGVRVGRVSRFTVVSAQDPFFIGLAGMRIAHQLSLPLQVQIHTDFMNPAYVFESPRRIIESLLARWVVSRASCLRVVSERVSRSTQVLTRSPLAVLPIRVVDVAEALVTPLPPEFSDKPTFITISRLTPEKRIHLVIDALKDVPGAELCIIGDGPLEESLKFKSKSLKLEKRIQFLGWRDDLAPYYQHAAGYIQMSRYEGYGMALVDAALHSCPAVTTDVGIVGDMLKADEHVVVTKGNAKALGVALTTLLADPLSAKPRAERAQKAARVTAMSDDDYLAKYKQSLELCGTTS